MRATARYGWRIAAVVAFGVTAALAVTLNRGAPLHAALTSVRAGTGVARSHEGAGAPRCTTSSLRVSVGAGAGPVRAAGLMVTRYRLGFTNVSSTACTLDGYPGVAAYRGDGVRVGNPAAADSMTIAAHVLVPSGGTVHATVIASLPAAAGAGGCRPVVAAGLRVVPPGESVARYVGRRLVACSAAGPRAPVFLSVTAVQPGTSAVAVFGTPRAGARVARADHRARATPSPGHTALAAGQAA